MTTRYDRLFNSLNQRMVQFQQQQDLINSIIIPNTQNVLQQIAAFDDSQETADQNKLETLIRLYLTTLGQQNHNLINSASVDSPDLKFLYLSQRLQINQNNKTLNSLHDIFGLFTQNRIDDQAQWQKIEISQNFLEQFYTKLTEELLVLNFTAANDFIGEKSVHQQDVFPFLKYNIQSSADYNIPEFINQTSKDFNIVQSNLEDVFQAVFYIDNVLSKIFNNKIQDYTQLATHLQGITSDFLNNLQQSSIHPGFRSIYRRYLLINSQLDFLFKSLNIETETLMLDIKILYALQVLYSAIKNFNFFNRFQYSTGQIIVQAFASLYMSQRDQVEGDRIMQLTGQTLLALFDNDIIASKQNIDSGYLVLYFLFQGIKRKIVRQEDFTQFSQTMWIQSRFQVCLDIMSIFNTQFNNLLTKEQVKVYYNFLRIYLNNLQQQYKARGTLIQDNLFERQSQNLRYLFDRQSSILVTGFQQIRTIPILQSIFQPRITSSIQNYIQYLLSNVQSSQFRYDPRIFTDQHHLQYIFQIYRNDQPNQRFLNNFTSKNLKLIAGPYTIYQFMQIPLDFFMQKFFALDHLQIYPFLGNFTQNPVLNTNQKLLYDFIDFMKQLNKLQHLLLLITQQQQSDNLELIINYQRYLWNTRQAVLTIFKSLNKSQIEDLINKLSQGQEVVEEELIEQTLQQQRNLIASKVIQIQSVSDLQNFKQNIQPRNQQSASYQTSFRYSSIGQLFDYVTEIWITFQFYQYEDDGDIDFDILEQNKEFLQQIISRIQPMLIDEMSMQERQYTIGAVNTIYQKVQDFIQTIDINYVLKGYTGNYSFRPPDFTKTQDFGAQQAEEQISQTRQSFQGALAQLNQQIEIIQRLITTLEVEFNNNTDQFNKATSQLEQIKLGGNVFDDLRQAETISELSTAQEVYQQNIFDINQQISKLSASKQQIEQQIINLNEEFQKRLSQIQTARERGFIEIVQQEFLEDQQKILELKSLQDEIKQNIQKPMQDLANVVPIIGSKLTEQNLSKLKDQVKNNIEKFLDLYSRFNLQNDVKSTVNESLLRRLSQLNTTEIYKQKFIQYFQNAHQVAKDNTSPELLDTEVWSTKEYFNQLAMFLVGNLRGKISQLQVQQKIKQINITSPAAQFISKRLIKIN